jgi:hypothetical protein
MGSTRGSAPDPNHPSSPRSKPISFFHYVRHPAEMAEPEINAVLTHRAVQEQASASTQNRRSAPCAFCRVKFWVDNFETWAKVPERGVPPICWNRAMTSGPYVG